MRALLGGLLQQALPAGRGRPGGRLGVAWCGEQCPAEMLAAAKKAGFADVTWNTIVLR